MHSWFLIFTGGAATHVERAAAEAFANGNGMTLEEVAKELDFL